MSENQEKINFSDKFAVARRRMVEKQLVPRGITDKKVLESMRTVPRHLFVPGHLQLFAYDDKPLPIGEGQTISQPYIVALMVQQLELLPNSRVLEIGTGSGYGAAVLSQVASQVFTVERHQILTEEATKKFKKLHYNNIHVAINDGSQGWPEEAPFDAIIVTAAAPDIPQSLLEQLAVGANLIIPMGEKECQELLRVRRKPNGDYVKENLGAVRFVPLIGKEGHPVS